MGDHEPVRARPIEPAANPSFGEALRVFAQIGLLSFGGPAGQIAMMHRVLVEQKKWIDEATYLLALNFCTLLPGPEAMQLATYSGWRLHGTRGGLAAGLLFVAPGALVILALAALYASFGNVPVVVTVFTGIKAAVLAIVVEALIRIARRSLAGRVEWLIAAFSFAAIFFFHVPFPMIILAAGLFGYWRNAPARDSAAASPVPAVAVPLASTARVIGIWFAIWTLPLLAVAMTFGFDHVLSQLALFFSKLAVVTFGGAYAVLAYMAQQVVEGYGWLKPDEMLDGLGLAETTPGPLILVTEFVGFLAAARHGGETSLLFGVLGAAVTLWATFVPCFLYVFAGAPYVEWLKSAPKLKSSLSAITAAVVGVIFNLSLWFSLHVLFRARFEVAAWPLRFEVPEITSLDPAALTLGILAALLLFVLRAGIVTTLGVSAAASLLLALLG
ncbi:chromate efflux transporter [Hyphomicrobium facile]|uniref:Chromate transporter n=1 Tax=Hyphomicrobium facile TaxID=51670 RepID=A0A1I7N088_9HYPH|nr:chromate efflux transporter [Hyphomicrobium facile]SFV27986.1 chromate transporter [Hyphomicrobium facile]